MADKLNDTDLSVQEVCTLPISWTQDNFKENIWRKVQMAMYPDVTSSAKLDTMQISAVYEEVNRLMANIASVSMDWPSHESQMNESLISEET